MNGQRWMIACALTVSAFMATILGARLYAAPPDPALPPYQFHREGAETPEDAAKALFRGTAQRSPNHFVQHLLLGVCDGPNATLSKFAECLHTTKFHIGDESYTTYDLPSYLKRDEMRVVGTGAFPDDEMTKNALHLQSVSTYYGQQFRYVDVAGKGHDGREYQTRIVVARIKEGWFAIPRCRSAKLFYEIADTQPGGMLAERKENPAAKGNEED